MARSFFDEAVRPVVERAAPGVAYLAGRLGSGSDVLGFDDARSQDHDFGCRLTLLVDQSAADQVAGLWQLLDDRLPERFEGHPVRFVTSWDPRPVHKVEVATVGAFAQSRLGVDLANGSRTPLDWLSLTGQSVLEVIGGPVFHDATREYGPLKALLSWYPEDVWRYILSASWARLSQELPLVGRAAERGDDLGSSIIAARLARDVVHLAFMIGRTWPPYPKWSGAALRALDGGDAIAEALAVVLRARDWRTREQGICSALDVLAGRHEEAGVTLERPIVQRFFDRPFRTVNPRVAETLHAGIADPMVRALPAGVGAIEQWCDNVDLLSHPARRRHAENLYRALIGRGGAR